MRRKEASKRRATDEHDEVSSPRGAVSLQGEIVMHANLAHEEQSDKRCHGRRLILVGLGWGLEVPGKLSCGN